MRNHILDAYSVLNGIYSQGTYGNMALNDKKVSDMSARLVHGVLEQNVRLDYILNSLFDKKPKLSALILLKIGAYALLNLDNVPDFAIVSECVEAAKSLGKGGTGGFINAVLKKVAARHFALPDEGDKNYLSITYSKPEWFVNRLINERGFDEALKIISAERGGREHIRINKRVTDTAAVKKRLSEAGVGFEDTVSGGLTVCDAPVIREIFAKGLITYQSPSSMTAVEALAPKDGCEILDLCSAPGGKAVFMAERCPSSKILACDIHPHRVELIKKYASRMKTPNVVTALCDASVLRKDWEEKFDYVMLDAPCSCFGTFLKHPDVFLSRGEEEISKLSVLQRKIADCAVRYVKSGGVLVYSTCTLFEAENENISDYIAGKGFIYDRADIPFENDGKIRILPHGEWDGFYTARLRKI